jgi:hypothetical protein
MIAPLVFSPRVLLARVWLFLLLSLAGPGTTAVAPPRSVGLEPSTPTRTRAAAPKPCAGLTPKPSCPRWASASDPVRAPPPGRPAPRARPPRRPRGLDPAPHFCPHEGGADRGWQGLGTLRATGHPRGGPWRPLHGLGGNAYLWETHGPRCHGNRPSGARSVPVGACLAAGLGLRAAARVGAVDAPTVLQGVVAAAAPVRALSRDGLGDVHVQQVPREACYAVRRAGNAGPRRAAEASKRLERAP